MAEVRRLLVVEDESGVRFFLNEFLAREGYEVLAVGSDQAALHHLQNVAYDLVLLDLQLKDSNGLDLLRTIRTQSPATVVIILTGHGTLESAVEALRLGATDYLFKPCRTVELRESIRGALVKQAELKKQLAIYQVIQQHLRGQNDELYLMPQAITNPADSSYEAAVTEVRFLQRGRFVIDHLRHMITFDGQILEISPTEYSLLAYLVGNAPRVVPHAELIREVRGYQSAPWEAGELLRYAIYRLRKKFRDLAPGEEVIVNRRGIGYALKE